jgi:leucyl aminopeptidase (aminopeptidase T)
MPYPLKPPCGLQLAKSVTTLTGAFKGALNLLRACAHARAGEKVLIVTDSETDAAIARTIMAAATQLGLETVAITMRPRVLPGDEPPAPVVAAMLSCDVIICPTSRTLFHTSARTAACARGARFISMAGATMAVLASRAMFADFDKQGRVLKKMVEELTCAKRISVTNPAGTDLGLSVLGRRGHAITGMCRRRGDATGVPDIEAYIAPLEDSTNGVLVIDGSTSVTGLVKEPLRIDIKEGIARTISGGSEARRLLQILRGAKSRRAFRVGEFGMGLNPLARVRGAIIEDEAALGTAHVALGDNHRFGGKINVPIHIDMVMKRAHVELDGKTVLDGKHLTL